MNAPPRTPPPRTCGELRKDGAPCGVTGPLYDDGHCGWHSSTPEAEEWRTAMRETLRQGGFSNRKPKKAMDPGEVPPPPRNLDDLKEWAAYVTWAVATGELDKDTAGKIVSALGEMRRIIKEGEHADRIKAIEEKIKRAQERKA